eukprot:2167466-Pyramimonas_sp.AAC.1
MARPRSRPARGGEPRERARASVRGSVRLPTLRTRAQWPRVPIRRSADLPWRRTTLFLHRSRSG